MPTSRTLPALPSCPAFAAARAIQANFNKAITDADSTANKPKLKIIKARSRNLIESDRMRARSVSDIVDEMEIDGFKDDPCLAQFFTAVSRLQNSGRSIYSVTED
jgi:hypothetical protein